MTDDTKWAQLRAPFPPSCIGKLPKPTNKDNKKGHCSECGGYHGLPAIHLDYVGHAAVTDRLLQVDPTWTWQPISVDAGGVPRLDENQGMWIQLTILGVTRLGYGFSDRPGPDANKAAISDAIRNAAMRFGVALDLWSKEDLSEMHEAPAEPAAPGPASAAAAPPAEVAAPDPAEVALTASLKAEGATLSSRIGKEMALAVWNAIADRQERLVAMVGLNADAKHILDILGKRGDELITGLTRAHAKDVPAFLASMKQAALGEVNRG